MRVGRALVPLSPANVDREPAHQLVTNDVGMGDQPANPPPPAPRLKLVFKQAETREVRAVAPGLATTHTSRTGRVVKPPTSFAPAPATAAGKRKPGFRKKEANIVCVHCGRGNSPGSNQIVFCDGCNATWHQKCSDPPIPGDVIEVRDKEWFCTKCKPAHGPSTKAQSSNAAGKKKTKTAPASSKIHHQPRQAPGLDVGGNQFTTHEQRGYLAALSHTQLVELVVHIAAQNPTVAIFPANLKTLPASQFAGQRVVTTAASSSVPGLAATAKSKKHGRAVSASASDEEFEAAPARPTKRSRPISAPDEPTTTNTTATKVKDATPSRKTSAPASRSASAKSSGTATSSTSRLQSASAEPDLSRLSSPEESELETDEDDFDEIEDHRLYPRPGNGFSTSTEPADLNILAEDPECQTFSHRLHGPAKQVEQTIKQAKAITKKAF